MVTVFTLSNFHWSWQKQHRPDQAFEIGSTILFIFPIVEFKYCDYRLWAIFKLSRSGKQIEIYDYPMRHPNDCVSLMK